MRVVTAALIAVCACARPAVVVPMTDGELAVQNLEAAIAGQERFRVRAPGRVETLLALSGLYASRARYLGFASDYDRAEEAAAAAVRTDPAEPQARLALAGALAALHRFDDSLAAAAEAARLGADRAAVDATRASALQGRGDVEAARAIRKAHAAATPDTTTLGALAAIEAEVGNLAEAERHLNEAARLYRDTSPLAPAWIEFQRGLVRERRADLTGARTAYEAALRRLPRYAQAAAHLAGIVALLGDRERAIELLRPLALIDDPEYAAQLAALTGDGQLRERARAGYERLVARDPEAFADHAARFYLATDARRALALAKRNLQARPTWAAFDLALTAARAARESSEACAIARRALDRGDPPPRIRALADGACSAAR